MADSTMITKCKICGKEFDRGNRVKKYCSVECSLENNRKQNLIRLKKRRKNRQIKGIMDGPHHNSYQKTIYFRIPKQWFKEAIRIEAKKEMKRSIQSELRKEIDYVLRGQIRLQEMIEKLRKEKIALKR